MHSGTALHMVASSRLPPDVTATWDPATSPERVQLSCQDWGCCLFVNCCDEEEGDKVLAGQL